MVQFKVEKKVLSEATVLLAQVANLKSVGASPSEGSAIYLTPTTLSLSNTNEANSIVVKDIPIDVVKGNVNDHVEKGYMVNTKKLASIVKGSKETVNFLLQDGTLAVGEGKRRFDLAIFDVPKKPVPEVSMFDYKVTLEDIAKNLIDADAITANSEHIAELSGTLFTKSNIVSSDKLSALYIEKGGMFDDAPEDLADVVISTDLFSACVAKTSEKEASIGFTTDGQKVVMKFGNAFVYKTMLSEKFPKDKITNAINGIMKGMGAGTLKATLNLQEFMEKLHEVREIVESEDYFIGFLKDSTVSIANSNVKSGAEGEVFVDAEVNLPEELGEKIVGKFSYTHLDMLGRIFSDSETIEIHSAVGNQGSVQVLRYLAVKTENRVFFCVPKS